MTLLIPLRCHTVTTHTVRHLEHFCCQVNILLGSIMKGTPRAFLQYLIRYFPINVLMLCRDDSVRVRDVNVCADKLCACILAEFHQLKVSEAIGKGLKFSGIFHDFEAVVGHKSLDETVSAHRSSEDFNTLSREHVTGEMMSNVCKVRIGVEEVFCAFKHMVCRGSLSEDFGLVAPS